jgi:hypothetical protein
MFLLDDERTCCKCGGARRKAPTPPPRAEARPFAHSDIRALEDLNVLARHGVALAGLPKHRAEAILAIMRLVGEIAETRAGSIEEQRIAGGELRRAWDTFTLE